MEGGVGGLFCGFWRARPFYDASWPVFRFLRWVIDYGGDLERNVLVEIGRLC